MARRSAPTLSFLVAMALLTWSCQILVTTFCGLLEATNRHRERATRLAGVLQTGHGEPATTEASPPVKFEPTPSWLPATDVDDFDLYLAEESALRTWMAKRGCLGMEGFAIRGGGRFGLYSVEDVTGPTEILRVPPEAMIFVTSGKNNDLRLAYRLLEEKSKGKASSYAPYIEYLWRRHVSDHSLYWNIEELRWLSPSKAAYEAVLEEKEKTESWVRKLLKKQPATSKAKGRGIGARQPKPLEEEQIRFAVALVATRGIRVQLEDGRMVAALIPMIDNMGHNPKHGEKDVQMVTHPESGGIMLGLPSSLSVGAEIRMMFEASSEARLLARYGVVSESKNREDVMAGNAFDSMQLQISLTGKLERKVQARTESMRALKLQILAERGGLDFRDAKVQKISLPEEFGVTGRLLPAADFLTADVELKGYSSEAEAVEAVFEKCFKAWLDEMNPEVTTPFAAALANVTVSNESDSQSLGDTGVDEIAKRTLEPLPEEITRGQQEIRTRLLVAEWCDAVYQRHTKVMCRLGKQAGFTVVDEDAVLQRMRSETEQEKEREKVGLAVGDIYQAHYKARSKKSKEDGLQKSKSPKNARILAIEEETGTLLLEFLDSNRKIQQRVPRDWLVVDSISGKDAAPEASPNQLSGQKLSRAKRAMALLFSESAHASAIGDMAYSTTLAFQHAMAGDANASWTAERREKAWKSLEESWMNEHLFRTQISVNNRTMANVNKRIQEYDPDVVAATEE